MNRVEQLRPHGISQSRKMCKVDVASPPTPMTCQQLVFLSHCGYWLNHKFTCYTTGRRVTVMTLYIGHCVLVILKIYANLHFVHSNVLDASTNVTCSNEMSRMSANLISRKHMQRWFSMMFSFCHQSILWYLFCQLAMLISRWYYYLVHFIAFLDTLHNISRMNFVRQNR